MTVVLSVSSRWKPCSSYLEPVVAASTTSCPSWGRHCGGVDSSSCYRKSQSVLAASARQVLGAKAFRDWCSTHRWWRLWTSLPLLMASMQAHLLPYTSPRGLVLSPNALLPILLLVWLPSYPLASTNTTCCQVLAISNLLCRFLDHLSAPPHHMPGCGDLDLISGSPHSPPGDPPPLGLPSPKWRWWASVGAQMRS
jgi:hypothetical protein